MKSLTMVNGHVRTKITTSLDLGLSSTVALCCTNNLIAFKQEFATLMPGEHKKLFQQAVLGGDATRVDHFLCTTEFGIDKNGYIGASGFTPLMYAADTGISALMATLIEHGVMASKKDPYGRTAMRLAVEHAQYSYVFANLAEAKLNATTLINYQFFRDVQTGGMDAFDAGDIEFLRCSAWHFWKEFVRCVKRSRLYECALAGYKVDRNLTQLLILRE